MAQNTYRKNSSKENKDPEEVVEKKSAPAPKGEAPAKGEPAIYKFLNDRKVHLSFGFAIMAISIFVFLACISHVFSGNEDQSIVEGLGRTQVRESGKEVENMLGIAGAYVSHYLIYKWFGLSFFLVLPLVFSLGFKVVFGSYLLPLKSSIVTIFFFVFWLSLTLGYTVFLTDQVHILGFLCGGMGYELAVLSDSILGWGTFILLGLTLLIFTIFFFDITDFGFSGVSRGTVAEAPAQKRSKPKNQLLKADTDTDEEQLDPEEEEEEFAEDFDPDALVLKSHPMDEEPVDEVNVLFKSEKIIDLKNKKPELTLEVQNPLAEVPPVPLDPVLPPQVKVVEQEFKRNPDEDISDRVGAAIEGLENYDPTLDLSSYQFPPLELLNEPPPSRVLINQEELKANSDKIVETLANYAIGISKISATIGPTVTLYEIVPDAGIRISKIKNLEDDIALSLSALGIRIIAPMPGKGTIGIEVPNKNKEMVSIRTVLASDGFQKSDKALPVVLGKTISNDVFVVDLAAMPHLL
ncbi:MAG TPA: DNA translocase FtsK 4TM domain-containing protein, partial [Cytophagales bacterium]|nr:DNA translocase FtsK 4TM domain-containing protein [Cytophagales bacterium]